MKKWTEDWDKEDLIVFRDEDILILNKPAGVLSQSDVEGDYSILKHFCKVHRKTYHLVNRIDRPVSGLIILASNPAYVQELVVDGGFSKKYLAVTTPQEAQEGELTNFLKRDGQVKKSRIHDKVAPGYKEAKLSYRVVDKLTKYELVEVLLDTGRFHQIRVQLAEINRHIKGDVKYGARRANKDRSIDLHAYHLSIPDKEIELNIPALREGALWEHINAYIASQASVDQ